LAIAGAGSGRGIELIVIATEKASLPNSGSVRPACARRWRRYRASLGPLLQQRAHRWIGECAMERGRRWHRIRRPLEECGAPAHAVPPRAVRCVGRCRRHAPPCVPAPRGQGRRKLCIDPRARQGGGRGVRTEPARAHERGGWRASDLMTPPDPGRKITRSRPHLPVRGCYARPNALG
jgi:hypothetical protein